MDPLRVFVLSLLLSMVAVLIVRAFARRTGLLDQPNERSSHTMPVPRLGGVAIVCGVWVSVAMNSAVRLYPSVWVVLISAFPLCLLAYDDILAASGRHLDPVPKLLIQLAAIFLLTAKSGYLLREVTLPAVGQVRLGYLALPATLAWLVYVTNVYNFMDGIDGLAGSQALLISGFLFAVAAEAGSSGVLVLSLALAGASLGFLSYNRPPASIMMGDVGSGFLGFTLAAMGLVGEREGISFLALPMLLSPFLFDGTYTLIRRFLRGENLARAHRFHLYQRLVRMGTTPARVDGLYALGLLPCGLGAMLLNRGLWVEAGFSYLLFLGYAVAGAWWVERRWSQPHVSEIRPNPPESPSPACGRGEGERSEPG